MLCLISSLRLQEHAKTYQKNIHENLTSTVCCGIIIQRTRLVSGDSLENQDLKRSSPHRVESMFLKKLHPVFFFIANGGGGERQKTDQFAQVIKKNGDLVVTFIKKAKKRQRLQDSNHIQTKIVFIIISLWQCFGLVSYICLMKVFRAVHYKV